MDVRGKNRDILINTFEGGLDLDTDKRLVPNNKLVESKNIDITKRGDSFVAKDLGNEEILFEFEDTSSQEAFILGSVNANFLIEPTSETRPSILVFYVKEGFNFIIRALYTDDFSSEVILNEPINESDFNLLKDGSVDIERVGKFGYDSVYFVDNRRQPRKIDCVKYKTNDNEITLTLNSEIDEDGYKQINLFVNSPIAPNNAHRVYVYAYKTGGPLVYTPSNPSTETIKFVEISGSGSVPLAFDIYPEDYGDYTFQIVYHKEGSIIYRNFTIGDPFRAQVSIGSFNNYIIGLRDTNDSSSNDQVPSWDFLYEGNSFIGYIDTPTVEVGVTKVYLTEIEDPLNYVPDGYYQRADVFNTYFRVINGVIVDQDINNGDVVFSTNPSVITEDVKLAAQLVEEGNKNRLDGVTIHVPQTIEVGGITYNFINTVVNNTLEGNKKSQSNNYTYVIERPEDLTVVSNYSVNNITLEAFVISILRFGSGYNVTGRAFVDTPLSENMDVSIRVQAIDIESGNILPPAIINVTILSGDNFGEATVYHDENFSGGGFEGGSSSGDVDYGPACVLSYTYLGPETITVLNAC